MQPDASIANNVHGRGSFLRRHRKKLIVVFILLAGVLIAAQVLNRQAGLIPVSAAEVVQGDFEQNVFASGKLEVKDLTEF